MLGAAPELRTGAKNHHFLLRFLLERDLWDSTTNVILLIDREQSLVEGCTD